MSRKVMGVPEFNRAMNSMDGEVGRRTMRQVLFGSAKVYAGAVERRAPKDTGKLKESIGAKPVTTDWEPYSGVTIKTGRGGAWYWHFPEFGTKTYSEKVQVQIHRRKYAGQLQTRYTTAGVSLGRQRYPKKPHKGVPARSYIRRSLDDWATQEAARAVATQIMQRRAVAWARKQAAAARRTARMSAAYGRAGIAA